MTEVQFVAENNIYIGDRKLVSVLTDMVIKKLAENTKDTLYAKGALI